MTRVRSIVFVVVVAVVLWWLFQPAHKAVVGDVLLGAPTVTASDPHAQANQDYYTSSTPGNFQ